MLLFKTLQPFVEFSMVAVDAIYDEIDFLAEMFQIIALPLQSLLLFLQSVLQENLRAK